MRESSMSLKAASLSKLNEASLAVKQWKQMQLQSGWTRFFSFKNKPHLQTVQIPNSLIKPILEKL